MDWLHNIFHKSPEIALFLSLAVGYFIGQINFGKFQLGGVGGSLLASLRREYPADRLRAAFQAAGVDRSAIVAFVSPAQWVELFRILDRAP